MVEIDYTNWKGERRIRKILPIHLWFGKTQWHPKEQWLLQAYDLEDSRIKDFAMSGIKSWNPINGE